ncbi:LuxR C-terminal-related transcriptional regulator [Plectonema radiosum NIES-515]|uniref:LuxR C-terminal-related transcriptional regulator n=1 Tax=Plectonema radiosum NIES-515 TaxID=2986073 RepID=A0ABT3AT94_9CYAN|nr:LuxR C-terminal-related transcriptional regulator [Plectonema radiosum]MCV3212337.1 LuxR C-terminal-related transcriptional regulator [Plectonema radiosum NIES-515]
MCINIIWSFQYFDNNTSDGWRSPLFIAQGLSHKCIGIYLQISPWTVATHLLSIFVKLGVTSTKRYNYLPQVEENRLHK